MAGPAIPWLTRPRLPRLEINMSSLKGYMIAKLVRGTNVGRAGALRLYDGIRNRTEDACALNQLEGICAGASENLLTFIADRLFWLSNWPHQIYPREDWLMTMDDKYAVIMAGARIRVHQCLRDSYTREARAWSKSFGERLARMVERT
ncbi:hypothetical protein DID88_008515 [Monilinia fructigena]|uniref:Uncharacterized protein n=1 Tax=Monilinia fructigena TaxID=38457 RepID=A0A395J6L5_9HELO|nr:hypothetical protein DID88_008515 [Monilinia fructigena]